MGDAPVVVIGWVEASSGSMPGLLREVAAEIEAIELKRDKEDSTFIANDILGDETEEMEEDTVDLTPPPQHMSPDHNMWQCKHPDCIKEQKRHGIHFND